MLATSLRNELFVVAPDASESVFWGGLRPADWVEQDLDSLRHPGTSRGR